MKSGAVNFVRHIRNMVTAEGKKRILYAFVNIIFMALAVAAAVGVKALYLGAGDGSINFVAAVIGIILCIAAGIYCFLQGFIAQLALVVIAGIGIARPGQRGANFAAFLIAFATSAGLIIAAAIILMKL